MLSVCNSFSLYVSCSTLITGMKAKVTTHRACIDWSSKCVDSTVGWHNFDVDLSSVFVFVAPSNVQRILSSWKRLNSYVVWNLGFCWASLWFKNESWFAGEYQDVVTGSPGHYTSK